METIKEISKRIFMRGNCIYNFLRDEYYSAGTKAKANAAGVAFILP